MASIMAGDRSLQEDKLLDLAQNAINDLLEVG